MKREEVLEEVGAIAAGQWGMFTSRQASEVGVRNAEIARLVAGGGAYRVRRGVYAMAGVPSGSLQDIRALWLALDTSRSGDGSEAPIVVSHESAALVWGIGNFAPAKMYVTSTHRIDTKQPDIGLHRGSFPGATIQYHDGLPVTSPRRTLEDIIKVSRWDDDHIHAAISDALEKGVLERKDIENSKVLRQIAPEYARPPADQSVRTKLRAVAAANGQQPEVVYGTFHRMLFAHELMKGRDDWVLKGGTGIFARIDNARMSRDLDIFRDTERSAARAARDIVNAMDGKQIGRYTYLVEIANSARADDGGSSRVMVTVMDRSTQVASFPIDVSGDVRLVAPPARIIVDRGDGADIPGYPTRLSLTLYPLENQVADKLCAMYETHQSLPSTRYRDLYDLAIIGSSREEIDQDALALAIAQQRELRGILHMPSEIVPPSEGWPEEYERMASKIPQASAGHTRYGAAVETASAAFGDAMRVAEGITNPLAITLST
ncbi:MAG: nucleotidyl transferase AbiEii/AbiGii toxin family protein [bacterium]|nr:nucleotidyl transferase AbiEii/AbiGii toxin family protein [bacterium]